MESTEKTLLRDPIVSGEESLRQHHELQILFDISSALHCSPHLQNVLQQALMAILQTLKFKMGAIYLVKEVVDDQWLLELAAHHGFSSTLINTIHTLTRSSEVMDLLCNHSPVRWFSTGKVVFPKLRKRMAQEQINEIICISLKSQNRVLGLLYVTNDGVLQLRPERSEFLTTIGHQIGVAIENAQLFDSVERAKTELEISFDAIQHSIFIIDTRWRIYRVNRTSERVYGELGPLVGNKYMKVLYGREKPSADCPIYRCFQEAKPVQLEGPHPRWGGIYHYYAFPVLNTAGTLERVVYYEKDVTEAKKLEQRLHQSERLKALGTLAAGIAHEIRNPLATINFNAQMLQRELGLDAAQQQMFDDMGQEIKKIDRIVQQVLHFARPREPQFLPNQLNDVVRYCFDLAKVYLRKANVEVSIQLTEDMPLLVMDFNQVSQVIMNLVINAIEAMGEGGKLTLRTFRQEEPSALALEVRDTGPGILEEDRERIFDPFFTRKPEGTGLGLSISRQILDKHGAYFDMDTSRGLGTTFRIIFPLFPENTSLDHH
jgi:signal transduction histidine kinase